MADARIGLVRESARGILRKYGIKAPPVLLDQIIGGEKLTVRTMSSWPDSVSGLLLRDDRLIGINGRHSPTRQRFTLAHELGHWFLRHDILWHEEEITIDNPPTGQATHTTSVVESEANEFAGELLASRGMLKDAMKRTRDGDQLANLFQMSPEALWVQILKHNLLK